MMQTTSELPKKTALFSLTLLYGYKTWVNTVAKIQNNPK